MPYSISQMIVDGAQNVVALDWAYSNPDGTLSNQHKLAEPYGSTKLAAVTEEVAISWLEEQLQNTAEEFDAAIAKRKAEADYAQTLVPYVSNGAGAFQVYVEPEPEPEPELEAAVMPAGRKAKK
jgi:hypothetical protein